ASAKAPATVSDDAIDRRTFGRMMGAAALGAHLPDLSLDMTPALDADARSRPAPDDLFYLTATELAARIRRKDLSAREVMTAHLDRIAKVNPKVNAIVTLVAERAMDGAT